MRTSLKKKEHTDIMISIPIIIICYNNHKYVEHTIQQLLRVNIALSQDIFILDNNSTEKKTIEYLSMSPYKVYYNRKNRGPWVCPWNNRELFNLMPKKFIVTDPDLEFHPDLPHNFVEILSELSDTYLSWKIGFALDISDTDMMFDGTYVKDRNGQENTIKEWESQFWKRRIEESTYELYYADIDTTFSMINKEGYKPSIRIAGNFTAKHIPWYKKNKIYNTYEVYVRSLDSNGVSTISQRMVSSIEEKYYKIIKKNTFFLIEKNDSDPNISFWKDIYGDWERETFDVFDYFLDPKKVFLDIGGWIGTTCMYASRNSKHVYAVEADKKSAIDLEKNCSINCDNYTVIHNAIYNIDDIEISFGKNTHLQDSKLNDSTSQIQHSECALSEGVYQIKTITLSKIIEKYKIDPTNISLIKVDIEGGEEHILEDLYHFHKTYHVPIYISFHYSWWKNMDLYRFSFLTDEQKKQIIQNPFISLVFV